MKKALLTTVLFFICNHLFIKIWATDMSNDITQSNVKEIIVIFKTHFDIGFTHRVGEVVDYYQTKMIDHAFRVMEEMQDRPEEERLTWTLPGWVASKIFENFPGQTTDRRKKIEDAIRSGTIITHALPFTMETEACGLEELVRGLGFASHLTRKYNLPLPRSGKQTDVPSHPGALATLLAHSDIHFLHIGCNHPSAHVQNPELFWWEGPDKSRILTFYSPIYGTNTNRFYHSSDWTGPERMIGKNLLPPANWPYQVWPAIIVTLDNVGPPSADQVKALLDEVKQQIPGVKIRMGTMDDFYSALMKEKPELPIVKSENPDTWIHGIMSDPGGIRMSREVQPLLASTETLYTQLKCWGIQLPDFTAKITNAYENVLLYGEHTWGGAPNIGKFGPSFKEIPPSEYAELEASWEDKTNYIREAHRLTHEMNQTNLEQLAQSVQPTSPSFLVYNPLPWARSGVVEIDNRKIFVKDIPACGYRTFPMNRKDQVVTNPSGHSIENDYFKIVFDIKKGKITSLIEKSTGREWVDQNANHGLGQYLNERFTFEQTVDYVSKYVKGGSKGIYHGGMYKPGMISEKEVPYRAISPENGQLKITNDGYMQKAELTLPGNPSNHLPSTVLRVTLFKNEPYIDMEITIQDKAKDNWPEADWLCLPFKIDNPEFRVYRLLGTMNPEEILPGANRHLYGVGNGLTITDADGAGIAVCPIDHPLISLDTPGIWKFSYDFVPQKPIIYLNLYNNQWNTNFRYWYPGTWSSRVRIWTLRKGLEKDVTFTHRALEARNPLQAVAVQNSSGKMPTKQAGIEVSRKGVLVTAFGVDPDGNSGTLLRVWEQAGVSGKLTVVLPKGMKVSKVRPVNLRGEKKGDPLTIKAGKWSFDLDAYAPASFILE